jgi:phosphate transport system substrate-binding protein
MMPSSQAVYDEIYQNPNAVGYVGMGFINNKVKAVSIALEENGSFVYPNADNVINNSYPISRPLYLYTNGEPKGFVNLFIKYALSEDGQKLVSENDFVSKIRV